MPSGMGMTVNPSFPVHTFFLELSFSPYLSVTHPCLHFALPWTPETLPEPPADLLPTQDPCAEDAGKYKCIAMNHFGEATANVNLNIEAEPEPKGQAPEFVEKPSIKFEEKMGRVLMEALVKADPKPTSAWSKDGKELDASRVTATVILEKEELYRIRLVLRVTSALCSFSLRSSSPPAPYNLRYRCQPLAPPAAIWLRLRLLLLLLARCCPLTLCLAFVVLVLTLTRVIMVFRFSRQSRSHDTNTPTRGVSPSRE